MKSLTICYITARKEPHFPWFFWSLENQMKGESLDVIIVDSHHIGNPVDNTTNSEVRERWTGGTNLRNVRMFTTRPKPSVWQGEHRLTKEDWWAISNARNTGICLCKTEWIAFLDDRCVLMPGYLPGIRAAMKGNYAVAGAYEKRVGMTVENGKIVKPGTVSGFDPRNPKGQLRKPVKTYGGAWCGANYALPLEWCLEVNGHDETCDSLGLEDVVFGNMLALNGHVTMYDPSMKMVEDRTPSACENMPLRTDKGVSPRDRSHKLLEIIGGSKRATHALDIRAERERVLRGELWTIPTEPKVDFWDGEKLEDMYVR